MTVRSLTMLPAILLAIGAYYSLKALPSASATELALLGADLAVLAVLGVIRGMSTTITTRDGYAFQKGTSLTLIMWLVTIAVRIGFVVAAPRLGIQNALAYTKAQRLGLRIAANKSELATTRR